jgi:hypothetical protein
MTQSGGFVILNKVKNPFSSHTRTVEVKEPQDWILRLAFGKSQNDTGESDEGYLHVSYLYVILTK